MRQLGFGQESLEPRPPSGTFKPYKAIKSTVETFLAVDFERAPAVSAGHEIVSADVAIDNAIAAWTLREQRLIHDVRHA
jgi:hypothetical protein